jgi:hypothetical protein
MLVRLSQEILGIGQVQQDFSDFVNIDFTQVAVGRRIHKTFDGCHE